MRRFFAILILAAIGFGVAVKMDWLPKFGPGPIGFPIIPAADLTSSLGNPLYTPKAAVKIAPNQRRKGPDPVIVAGSLSAVEKMEACAQVAGQILFIGKEIPDGAVEVAGIAPFLQGKIFAASFDVGDSRHDKLYLRLSEGDIVGQGERLGLVDPAKAVHSIREKSAKLAAAEVDEATAETINAEAQRQYAKNIILWQQKAISDVELGNSKATAAKTMGEWRAKIEATKIARIDLTKEKLLLSQHYVLNRLPVKQAIIKKIHKRTGEAVKDLEPVLELYAVDRLMAEGQVETQYLNRLAIGQKAIVEPTREISPMRVWRSHKKEITAVAAMANGLAASASEDGTVCLWDQNFVGPVGLFAHAQPVRSLAVSPAGAKTQWLLAGLADGSIAVWDLGAFKPETPGKLLKLLACQYPGAVTAIAFSPDGRYFATGSTNGAITLWDVESPNECRLYPFDASHGVTSPHSGQVTALAFTPQCKLVSAGDDNTLRIWSLREKGAVLEGEPIAGRAGAVKQLGVSRDGGALLFDQEKTLQVLTPDGRAVATLQNPGTIPFETLAQFSPDASLLMTAGVADGLLQLWKAPTDGQRAFELRRFVTGERAGVTSAAFFDGSGFAVSGSKDGTVYLWPLPTRADIAAHRVENVTLTAISQNQETRQVRIGVELPNDGRFIPGQPVTMVFE